MTFIKTAVVIQSGNAFITIWDANDFSGEIDMDNLYGTLSFTIPYKIINDENIPTYSEVQSSGTLNVHRLEKDMLVTLYYKELEFNREITTDEMDVIFDGRIDNVEPSKSKTDSNYEIKCEALLSFANNRPPIVNIVNWRLEQMPNAILQRGNLQAGPENPIQLNNQIRDYIPQSKVNVNLGGISDLVAKSVQGSNIKDIITNFRDKNGVIFIQQLSGEVDVFSYGSMMFANEGETIEAWQFDVNDNVFNLKYGNVTSDYEAVIIYGAGGIKGEAIDVLKCQAKGIAQDENGNYKCRYYRYERRDLFSEEDCQKVAREMLLEMNKNYLISFETKFLPNYKIGHPFQIKDYDLFSGEEIWFIKSINWKLGKGSFDCEITGFANSLVVLPENLVLSNTGVADVDVLRLRNKVAAGDWVNFE